MVIKPFKPQAIRMSCFLFIFFFRPPRSVATTAPLMGFLSPGTTLPWSKAKEIADFIRKQGIEQFLAIYERTKHRTNDALLWGDEVRNFNKSSTIIGGVSFLRYRWFEVMAAQLKKKNKIKSGARSFRLCCTAPFLL